MTDKQLFDDREAWLTEASNLILDDMIMPLSGDRARPEFRISIGFPKHSRGGKAIAVCFAKEASSDNVNEIFINPEIDNPIQVLASNVHELIHAVDNCENGHKGYFAETARAVGLEGKLTSTYAGPELEARLKEYARLLGKFPHHKMNSDVTHKPDGTRQRKVQCSNVECGFIFRTSQKWINRLRAGAECPCCGERYTLKVSE